MHKIVQRFVFLGKLVFSLLCDPAIHFCLTAEYKVQILISAFLGYEKTMHAYEVAVQEKYRFFSFGDAMCILPEKSE